MSDSPPSPEPNQSEPAPVGKWADPLRPFLVPIMSLRFDPENARRHPEKNLEAIKASFRQFGQRKPLVVQRSTMIVRAGNGGLMAAMMLGWTHVAAILVDEDDANSKAFGIADNRTGELAEWDETVLASVLDQLREAGPDIEGATGFNAREIDNLLGIATGDVPSLTGDGTGQIRSRMQVVVECRSEQHQRAVYQRLTGEGEQCHLLTL